MTMDSKSKLTSWGIATSILALITCILPFVSFLFSGVTLILFYLSRDHIKKELAAGKTLVKAGLIIVVLAIILTSVLWIAVDRETKITRRQLDNAKEANMLPLIQINRSLYANASGAADQKAYATIQSLSWDSRALMLYKTRLGSYPANMSQALAIIVDFRSQDAYGNLTYKRFTSGDYEYILTSNGKDGILGTPDDISLLKNKLVPTT